MELLKQIPLKNTRVDDPFWNRYTKLVTSQIIPYQWRVLNDQEPGAEKSHCIENFRIAAGRSKGEFYGFVFQDSDLAKWLEAVAYSLSYEPNAELEKTADETIELIGAAQQKDGYLDTFFILKAPQSRWHNLQQGHELYCAGHMMEAAAAYFAVTGKDALLKIMCRTADLICEVFHSPGFEDAVPGHEEVEIGLTRLYQQTGEQKYLDMAFEFINRRGQNPDFFAQEEKGPHWLQIFPEMDASEQAYFQAHKPVRQQTTAEGHAVRAVYLYRAMADLAALKNDDTLLKACETLYDNITRKRMYITGGIGSSGCLERFTTDYDLPNASGYAESCASVGLAFFCRSMFLATRDGKYGDTMERALMNTVLSGISQDGKRFFYVNPQEVWPDNCLPNTSMQHVKPVRQKWFGCACCPPNIARTLASLGEDVWCTSDNCLWLNLFVAGETHTLLNGVPVTLHIETRYPFDGAVRIHVQAETPVAGSIALRLPGFVHTHTISIDGRSTAVNADKGYLYLTETWQDSMIEYAMDIPAHFAYSNPKVRADAGRVAVVKGPLVYCLEQADNGGNLSAIQVDTTVPLKEEWRADLLGGCTAILAKGFRAVQTDWPEETLYGDIPQKYEPLNLTFVPYCMWDNRAEGEMAVWIRDKG